MNEATFISLIVALARYLEVPPEKLAEFFMQDEENQEYFDLVLKAYNDAD